MRCITIRQPWAWAIFNGKDIENRDWPTRFRGRVAIHAAKGLAAAEYNAALRFCYEECGLLVPDYEQLSRGYILGTVEIVDCVSSSPSLWFMGKYGFVLRDARLLAEPIQAKGALGFWEPDEETRASLARQQGVFV